jgi:hypothetical protein
MESERPMKIEAMGKPEGCKLLRISAVIGDPPGRDSQIERISVRGDFFAVPEEAFEVLEKTLSGTKVRDLAEAFETQASTLGLKTLGISGQALQILIEGQLDGR